MGGGECKDGGGVGSERFKEESSVSCRAWIRENLVLKVEEK